MVKVIGCLRILRIRIIVITGLTLTNSKPYIKIWHAVSSSMFIAVLGVSPVVSLLILRTQKWSWFALLVQGHMVNSRTGILKLCS